ncbi:MAG TPA: helix-hairpin-helix domain-containing protein [Kofleriaceae bacterium]|nr:helix-hairpin-helix domain-containing protein [Kofleriaceae bacterium]
MRVVLVALLCLAACNDPSASRSAPPPPTMTAPIDLNTATEKQLETLPGIGPKHARSIIASRNARGGHFQRLEDLLSIDGIGPGTIDKIRPYVVLN